MAKKPARPAVNSSATHVFEVLRLVSAAKEPVGVSEIARQQSLPASTVYRALITLEESEYISRFQNSPRYELGPLPRLLTRALLRRFALHDADEHLRTVAEATGETAAICARVGWYSVRVCVAYGASDLYHRDRLGEVTPLHASLPSRAILAALSDDDATAFWRFAEKRFKVSAAERKAVEASIEAARRDGFASEPSAMSPGHSAVALALRDAGGAPLASLSLNGPVVRSGAGMAPPAGVAARKTLEALIAADPARYASPFAHLNADDIHIRVPA